MSDRDTIERAIRRIDSCLDVDPWARDIAIDAMQRLLEQASCRQVTDKLDDTISRQDAIYAVENCEPGEELFMIKSLPSVQPDLQPTCNQLATDTISRQAAIDAIISLTNCTNVRDLYVYVQEHNLGDMWTGGVNDAIDAVIAVPSVQPEPEITDEQAILHLQSTGWMQNYDREMYESGLREQLADDSGSYDSLIPCEDTISRQDAIDALLEAYQDNMDVEFILSKLPSAQPERKTGRWISVSADRYTTVASYVYVCSECGETHVGKTRYCPNCGAEMSHDNT